MVTRSHLRLRHAVSRAPPLKDACVRKVATFFLTPLYLEKEDFQAVYEFFAGIPERIAVLEASR